MTQILIVDDDPTTLHLLEKALSFEGYQIVSASRGAKAIEAAHKFRPKLLLLDLMMPGMSGIEVCRAIRADPKLAHIPILMLTAVAVMDQKVAAFDAGADDYLTKPVHPKELISRVKALLARETRPRQPAEARPTGAIISIIGASGGVGATTVTVNLAATLLAHHPETVIAELHPGMGGIALQLGLTPEKSLADLTFLSKAALNHDAIQSAVARHPCGLKLLPAGHDPRMRIGATQLLSSHIELVIRQLAQDFDFVFLDLGHGYGHNNRVALALSHKVLFVVKADRLSLQAAVRQIQYVQQDGFTWQQLHVALVALTPSPYNLKPSKGEQSLHAHQVQSQVCLFIPPIASLTHLAIQQGMPMVLLQPGGSVAYQQFKQALDRILGNTQDKVAS